MTTMLATISKRFELSSSHRLAVPGWSDERNRAVFGSEAEGRFGHGHNYVATLVFSGPVDPVSGMMINVTEIKHKAGPLLNERYDHRYLNADTPPFDHEVPTAENLARAMLRDTAPLFGDGEVRPVACHLAESELVEATAYESQETEKHYWIIFSAARVTRSPHLSGEENRRLFGAAARESGHGHQYRLRLTLSGQPDTTTGLIVPETDVDAARAAFMAQFDHVNLSTDVPDLASQPTTTEFLADYFLGWWKKLLPIDRVRLWENDWFFAEAGHGGEQAIGLVAHFNAAHRLHAPNLSESENKDIYGVCNNPRGHGHRYRVEMTLGGRRDPRTGVLFDLGETMGVLESVLSPWQNRHLNLETDDFDGMPTTGENIINVLWQKLAAREPETLNRLRLWETPNNRFAVRRQTEL